MSTINIFIGICFDNSRYAFHLHSFLFIILLLTVFNWTINDPIITQVALWYKYIFLNFFPFYTLFCFLYFIINKINICFHINISPNQISSVTSEWPREMMREFQNGISNLLLLLAFSINRCKLIQTKENQLIISIIREYFLCHKTILNYSFFNIHQRSTLVFVKLLLLLFHDREKKKINKQIMINF